MDVGDLTGLEAGGQEAVAARVSLALAEGAARVQGFHDADDRAAAWACARAGLRREGVLRGVPSAEADHPGTRDAAGRRDLAVVSHVVGDPPVGGDVLPALVPLFPTSLLSAGLVLRDPAGRVLMLRTSYKEPWEVPGGVVEDDEGLHAAAAREAREELGLDLVPGRLLVLDRRGGDGRQPQRLLALLDGGVHDVDLPSRCRFLDGEVLEASWCTPVQVRARTGQGLAARVEAALARLEAGEPAPALLADGAPEHRDPGRP